MATKSENENPMGWQTAYSDMKSRVNYILGKGMWTDCTFVVETETDQVIISAHKIILATGSPVFEAMFYGPFSETDDKPVVIKDMKPDTFKQVLMYIYTDLVELKSTEGAYELYYGAHKYMLPWLRTKCTEYLSYRISLGNACHAFQFAQLFNDQKLKESSLKFIKLNASAVLKSTTFDDVNVETLVEIFSQDKLAISSELELYNAAERYAESHLVQKAKQMDVGRNLEKLVRVEMEKTANSEQQQSRTNNENQPLSINKTNTMADMRRILRPALQKIRFLTLTPKQFSEYKSIRSLLTDDEILALSMNISSRNTCFLMPEGFSELIKKRKYQNDYD